jgi:hypothetical protein
MDDAVKLIEKLSGGRPYSEGADLPVVGRMIDRKSIGFQSQSVKSVTDLDARWQELNLQLEHIIKDRSNKDENSAIRAELVKLNRAHRTMLVIEKIWKQVKAESAKTNPDRDRIDRLKQLMTKRAKVFLSRYHPAGENKSVIL